MSDAPILIDVGQVSKHRISLFNRAKSKRRPRDLPIHVFLHEVQQGRWRSEIEKIRNAPTKSEADLYKLRLLPAAKLSGTFSGLGADDLIEHSGVLCLDLDDVGSLTCTVQEALRRDPYVLAFFTSPRGTGLKVLVVVVAINAKEHRACFEAARDHFVAVLPSGVKIDPAPRNIASNCFASYDPNTWRATEDRLAFKPASKELKIEGPGCDIDMSHVIQSNEKELPPSPPLLGDRDEQSPSSTTPQWNDVSSPVSPLPSIVRLPNFADAEIWPNWMKRVTYDAGKRNETIVRRVPILLNLAAEDVVALLLLRWFNEAPDGRFKGSRELHWKETWSAIDGCLDSWPRQERIGKAERRVYERLRDARQRATFRICRSLSLAKKNAATRVFFVPVGQLADRLNCGSEPASRQLEYLLRDGVIELVEQGAAWAPGQKSRAAAYRWAIPS